MSYMSTLKLSQKLSQKLSEKLSRIGVGLLAVAILGGILVAPLAVRAQDHRREDDSRHRQQTKNTWRNVAIGAGALGVLGLAEHNNTLAVAGIAGGLYSVSRYEHDRKSQSHIDHSRAELYGRRSYTHNGHHYVRKTVHRNGHDYYQFIRG